MNTAPLIRAVDAQILANESDQLVPAGEEFEQALKDAGIAGDAKKVNAEMVIAEVTGPRTVPHVQAKAKLIENVLEQAMGAMTDQMNKPDCPPNVRVGAARTLAALTNAYAMNMGVQMKTAETQARGRQGRKRRAMAPRFDQEPVDAQTHIEQINVQINPPPERSVATDTDVVE